MSQDIAKRPGEFCISGKWYKTDGGLKTVMCVLQQVAVTRCEYIYLHDEFCFSGLSEEFDEVEAGDLMPRYDVTISINGEGERSVIFKRSDKVRGDEE